MFKRQLVLLVLAIFPVFAFAYPTSFPNPTGFVTDTAGMLSVQTKQNLENELKAFAETKGYEVAVLTVTTLQGTTVEDYATRVFDQWKIGDKKLSTGVLFLIAKDDRQMRIEVGYGAEPVLTDAQSSQILNNTVAPLFKEGNYEEGIKQGVREIEGVLSGEPVQTTGRNYNSSTNFDFRFLILVFMFVQFLASYMAKTKSWWFGGVAGAIISSIITFIFMWTLAVYIKIIIILISTALGLLIDFFVSKHWNDTPRGPNIWWLGGGRSGGGGGFGGFGGGMSGGGGSSGRW